MSLFKMQGDALPSSADLLATIIKTAPWPKKPPEECGLNQSELDRLHKAWLAFTGPVRDPQHFAVIQPLAWEMCGYTMWAHAEYVSGEIIVDARPEEDINNDLLRYVPPPQQLKAERKVGPNAPCPCKSGRKYKKCCARRI